MLSRFDAYAFGTHLVPDEHIVAVLHRHWFVVVWPLIRSIAVGIVLPFAILIGFWGTWWVAFLFLVLIAAGALYVHHSFFDWFSDVFIITSRGLLRIDWKSPFRVNSERIDLSSIDTVEYTKKGFFATIFSYGELIVVTANSSHKLETIHHPRAARDLLSHERDRARSGLYGTMRSDNEDATEDAERASSPDDASSTDVAVLRSTLKKILTDTEGHRSSPAPVPHKTGGAEPPSVNDVRPPA